MEPRPLTEQELIDWERWSRRDIKWEGSDVARLLAMVRELQKRVAELESRQNS
ncbi:MAG: hypothetical protein ACAH95_17315 [Fimbriimonas sp.]